jgi:hypothetical protein
MGQEGYFVKEFGGEGILLQKFVKKGILLNCPIIQVRGWTLFADVLWYEFELVFQ